jgi:hypothetical protein
VREPQSTEPQGDPVPSSATAGKIKFMLVLSWPRMLHDPLLRSKTKTKNKPAYCSSLALFSTCEPPVTTHNDTTASVSPSVRIHIYIITHCPLGTRVCVCLFSLLSFEHQSTYYSIRHLTDKQTTLYLFVLCKLTW